MGPLTVIRSRPDPVAPKVSVAPAGHLTVTAPLLMTMLAVTVTVVRAVVPVATALPGWSGDDAATAETTTRHAAATMAVVSTVTRCPRNQTAVCRRVRSRVSGPVPVARSSLPR